jgi:short-subunit dehydrogenase
MEIRDAHVVITGGSKGIGAALAKELAGRGARLTLIARPSDELEKVAADTGGVALPVDLSDLAAVRSVVSRAEAGNGPVDALVNNAALGMTRGFPTLSADDVQRCLTTNLLAPMELSRQVLPGMLERQRGTVVNISSVVGELAVPHLACYATSKAGLTMFSLDLQRDLKGSPVAVMAFVLGAVPGTQIYVEGLKNEVIRVLADRIGKVSRITPERVARQVADALATDRRRVMTVLPRTGAPLLWWRHLPVRLGDLVFDVAK